MVNKYEKTFNLIRNQGNAFSDHNKIHFRWVKFQSLTLPNVIKDVQQQELYHSAGGSVNGFNFFKK